MGVDPVHTFSSLSQWMGAPGAEVRCAEGPSGCWLWAHRQLDRRDQQRFSGLAGRSHKLAGQAPLSQSP